MPLADLPVLIMVFMVLLLALLMLYFGTRRWRAARMRPDIEAQIKDVKLYPGEEVASVVGEQIEEMVRQTLSAYPDLANVKLDFGTLPDQGIDIIIDGQQYYGVDAIPDERIREAIREAVARFNRR